MTIRRPAAQIAHNEITAALREAQEDHDLRNSELVEAVLDVLSEIAPRAYHVALMTRAPQPTADGEEASGRDK